MPNEKFLNIYRIKSARVTWHDYNGGAYFITICTKKHEHFLGKIINVNAACRDAACHVSTNIQLSTIGQFLVEKIQNITDHYSYAEIPLFVVMPNHWHAIVFIDGHKTPYVRGGTACSRDVACRVFTGKNGQMQNIANKQSWLSVAIGGIKSAVTKFAHENDIVFAWQTRFHDHIIRDQEEMNRIADYIENNPARWDTDCYNNAVKTRHATSLQNNTNYQTKNKN